MDAGIQATRKRGVPIEDISDPATRNYNLVWVEDNRKKG
jgi:hypothetical protein